MAEEVTEITFGFVCPDWAKNVWNQNECTVEPATDGTVVVLDHSIQTVVYVGHTRKECDDWLGTGYRVEDWLTDCAIDTGVMVTCPDCGETYWSENGHPEGTLCPKFGIEAIKETRQNEPGKVECKKHPGTVYWWEDFCPECMKEENAEKAKSS